MFIARRDIADDYFQWLFSILTKLENEIDFSEYEHGNLRVLGYLSEFLLTVYVKKNNLKVKERYYLCSQGIAPHFVPIVKRFPLIDSCLSPMVKIINKFRD